MNSINKILIAEFSDFQKKISQFKDIGHTGLYIQRMDYALSCLAGIQHEGYERALRLRFEGEVLEYLMLLNDLGYLRKYGRTVDPTSYLVRFTDINVSYLWLPKNACTNTKKLFANIYPELSAQLKPNLFHETFQAVFGIEKDPHKLIDNVNLTLNEKLFFCVIRDPIERLVSCYVDKFVKPIWLNRPFEGFIESYIKSTLKNLGIDRQIRASITFREFVYSLLIAENWSLDSHWRPQVDFLPTNLDSILFIDVSDTRRFCAELFDILLKSNHARFGHSQEEVLGGRANSSLGKQYGKKQKVTGKCTDFLPIQYMQEDVESYNDYPDSNVLCCLGKLYEMDYELCTKATPPENFSHIFKEKLNSVSSKV